MRFIYIVNNCDEWKSTSSMSIAMATTSIKKLIAFIKLCVKEGDFIVEDGAENIYKNALANRDLQGLNNALMYCDIEIIIDGESQ